MALHSLYDIDNVIDWRNLGRSTFPLLAHSDPTLKLDFRKNYAS